MTYYKVKNDHIKRYHQKPAPKPKPKPHPEMPKSAKPSRENASQTPAAVVSQEEGPIDVYAVLGINPQCSQEEAKRAARQSRIDTHPDKLKRDGMSAAEIYEIDEMAKLVGFAADTVVDPVKRWEYDRSVMEWRNSDGRL